MLWSGESVLVDSLLDVATGRGLDRPVLDITRSSRCLARAAGVRPKPLRPCRPPAARVLPCALEPCLRIFRKVRRGAPVGPVAAPVLAGRIDHAGNVAARPEHEGSFAPDERQRAIR